MRFKTEHEKGLEKIVLFGWVVVVVFALLAVGVWSTGFKLTQPKPKCLGLPEYLSYEKHSVNEKGDLVLVLSSTKDLTLNKLSLEGQNFALLQKKSVVQSLWIKKNEKTTIKATGPPQTKGEAYLKELRLRYNFLLEDKQRIAVAKCTGKIE